MESIAAARLRRSPCGSEASIRTAVESGRKADTDDAPLAEPIAFPLFSRGLNFLLRCRTGL